ncbi:MAG: zf-TFIIB domain-containing protein [Humidesulfovibrio sp.]|nr:zf-TFIIB domain-containing protein [Humidesulfovibrio sp.]
MNCPQCNISLVMTERSGIEIDYCPQCRGVWLDRGELDKIIERSAASQPSAPVQHAAPVQPQHQPSHYQQQPVPPQFGGHGGQHDSHYKHKQGHGSHKKKSILGELFDF